MANPFQQPHGSSSFMGGGDSASPSGLPPTQRRTSYASVLSGATSLSRPPRAGTFSHLLNPSPDSEPHSSLYTAAQSRFLDATASAQQARNAASGMAAADDYMPSSLWGPPRPGARLPLFSRAFDPYLNRDPMLLNYDSEDGLGGSSLVPGSGPAPATFLSPSYLRDSVFLGKLREAHNAKILADREGHLLLHHHHHHHHNGAKTQSGPGGAGGVSSGSGGGSAHHLHGGSKLPSGSHRGVAYELVEKTLAAEEDDALSPLPSRWSRDDKDGGLEVMNDGYEVKYVGRPASDHEACAIRADHYMPPQCGVYYYEVTILSGGKREDTAIGVGFASKSVALQRAPGWEPESWGYHGDDGHCFAAQNVGKSYGPKFGPKDTIGCLINFRLGHALFTKNGDELGIAFRDVSFKDAKGKLYPTVGMKKQGDHVYVNFGQLPFQYDIDGYMKKQQKMISENIKNADTSKLAPSLSESELIQQLVLQFLQHDGYVETARAFAEEIHAEKKALSLNPDDLIPGINIKDDEDANNRQRIRRAVLEGDIDQALKFTKTFYPNVLDENEQVYFRLRCRKFIEMIRKEAEYNLLLEKRGLAAAATKYFKREEDDEEMFDVSGGGGGGNVGHNWDADNAMDTDDAFDGGAAAEVSQLSQEALAYGMELRSEFSTDPRREVSKHLDEIFALIAYPNPLKVKEVAHLLDRSGRAAVAEELNSAILMSLGKSSRAALENLYAQTCVLLEDLRQDGGDGAFVTVQHIIDEIPKPSLL
ncbi:hypothetical protein B0T17DRAFT_587040 [Bombardia bombarda]|uniref:Protein SSH4 n=1 Tax=Bombardia bombarda TaxID=252184 RepID=A0AA40CEJ3_9PEZI|nr:hypothetical protein B0T17DRAFT_587040 [Bombardia bombarda]